MITATSAIHTLWIWKKWVATVHDCLWASLGSQESRSKNKSGSIQAVNSLGQPNQHATRNSTITHQNAGRSTGRSTWIAALIFVKSLRMSKNQILGFRGAITPIITGSYISWWWFVSSQWHQQLRWAHCDETFHSSEPGCRASQRWEQSPTGGRGGQKLIHRCWKDIYIILYL